MSDSLFVTTQSAIMCGQRIKSKQEQMPRKGNYDLNFLLVVVNVLLCITALALYIKTGPNQYINLYSVILLFLFGSQNSLILLYGRAKREPFILILAAVTTVFYLTRIVSLLFNPSSITFNRSIVTPSHINYSLVFIMLSNLSIFLGLNAARQKIFYNGKIPEEQRPARALYVIINLFMAIFLQYFGLLPVNILGRFSGYILAVFFRLNLILLLSMLYLIINYRRISIRSRFGILGLILLFVLFNTITGNRSSLLILAVLLVVVLLSIKGEIVLKKEVIFLCILFIPFSIFLYNLATVCRPSIKVVSDIFSGQKRLEVKETRYFEVFHRFDINKACQPVFDRIGFLDVSVDIIKHKDQYSKIINFKYYIKSIVDNCLTPGFNIFGTPRVENALKYIYSGLPSPTHQDINNAYHADMLTIYAEYYVLFGQYPALLVFFISSYIFKRIYSALRSENVFLIFLYRAVVLLIFYEWLENFGIDWFVFDLIGIFITVFLFKNFYKMRTES